MTLSGPALPQKKQDEYGYFERATRLLSISRTIRYPSAMMVLL